MYEEFEKKKQQELDERFKGFERKLEEVDKKKQQEFDERFKVIERK